MEGEDNSQLSVWRGEDNSCQCGGQKIKDHTVCVCVCACVRACVRACVCVRACAC